MEKKKLAVPLAALALVVSAGGGIVAAAHADTSSGSTTAAATTNTQQAQDQEHDGGMRQRPAAVGKVTAISGSSITLTDDHSGTTYTVDASSATIEKFSAPSTTGTAGARPTPTTISVSGIAVGDTLMVQGTVTGTTITATRIADGMPFGGHGGHGFGHDGVHGTVTAVNGSTITVQDPNGTTYTVDASNASASKIQTISVSNVTVGDSVDVDGTVSGTTVTAKHLMDGVPSLQR